MSARSSIRKRAALASVLLSVATGPRASGQCQGAKFIDSQAGVGGQFGFSVAMGQGVALIGAPFDDELGTNTGAVFVAKPTEIGWSLSKLVRPTDIAFGFAVALSGNIGVATVQGVGADVLEPDGGGNWSATATLIPADGIGSNVFGHSVAVSGGTIAVGARGDDDQAADAGSIYVYDRDPNGAWSQTMELHASDGQPVDRLGWSVAIDGDTIVAGARDDDDLGFASGSAYVFERDTGGIWVETAKLLPSDGLPFYGVGTAVGVLGNVAFIGAPGANGSNLGIGAVFVFERQLNGQWLETQKLEDDQPEVDGLGWSIAMDGDLAVVGARRNDCGSQIIAGAAYVYQRQPSGLWTLQGKVQAEDCQERDEFGYAVGLSGNTAIISAWLDDDVATDAGSAYIFSVGPDADANGVMDVCECPADPSACPCPGDLDADRDIDLTDLAIQLAHYGTPGGAQPEDGDIDGDGDVDLTDLSLLLAAYGGSCE